MRNPIIEIIKTDEAQPLLSAPLVGSRYDADLVRSVRRIGVALSGGDPGGEVRKMLSALASLAEAQENAAEQREAIIRAFLPEAIPTDEEVWHLRRNAEARHGLIEKFGALTAAQVAEHAGSKARNKAATAHNWAKRGRVFSVAYRGETLYPSFQFDEDGQPRNGMAETIATLAKSDLRGWEVAIWFDTPTGWLGGMRPVELLERAPDRVVEAAGRRLEGSVA